MSHVCFNICLPAALMFVLASCGSDTDQLAPKAADGAPTYEQLNPPVSPADDSSMAPATRNSDSAAP